MGLPSIYSLGEEKIHKACNWMFYTFLISFVVMVILMIICYPLSIMYAGGFSEKSIDKAFNIAEAFIFNPQYLYNVYFRWFFIFIRKVYFGEVTVALIIPVIPSIAFFGGLIIGWLKNPYSFKPAMYGDSKFATEDDIERLGLFKGFNIVLGMIEEQFIRFTDTLSAICVGTTGSGKTSGIVLPTILTANRQSIFAYDIKKEAFKNTSMTRSKKGFVFHFNWGGKDDEENGILYPKWNPLSLGNLPEHGPGRENYVSGLSYLLVKGSQDINDYWVKISRSAFEGLAHFIIYKTEQAISNDYFLGKLYDGESLDEEDYQVLTSFYKSMKGDQVNKALVYAKNGAINLDNYLPIGSWEGLPEPWQGRQGCFSMLIDWITQQQIFANLELKARKEAGDTAALQQDPMRYILDKAIEEAIFFGYSRRAIMELNQLATISKKQRASVISMVMSSLGVFKNNTIRNNTCFSDFFFTDLRGIKDDEKSRWGLTSVYLTDKDDVTVPLSSTFIEMSIGASIVSRPGKNNMGPYPLLYTFDDLQNMPKMTSVKKGTAMGRSQKVSFLLCTQNLFQLNDIYGFGGMEEIISNTGAKIIFRENNEKTGKKFQAMSAMETVNTVTSIGGGKEIFGINVNQFDYTAKYQQIGKSLVSNKRVLTLKPGKHYVMMQGAMDTPIIAQTPYHYKDKEVKALVNTEEVSHIDERIVAKRDEQDLNPPELTIAIPDVKIDGVMDVVEELYDYGNMSAKEAKKYKEGKSLEYILEEQKEYEGLGLLGDDDSDMVDNLEFESEYKVDNKPETDVEEDESVEEVLEDFGGVSYKSDVKVMARGDTKDVKETNIEAKEYETDWADFENDFMPAKENTEKVLVEEIDFVEEVKENETKSKLDNLKSEVNTKLETKNEEINKSIERKREALRRAMKPYLENEEVISKEIIENKEDTHHYHEEPAPNYDISTKMQKPEMIKVDENSELEPVNEEEAWWLGEDSFESKQKEEINPFKQSFETGKDIKMAEKLEKSLEEKKDKVRKNKILS